MYSKVNKNIIKAYMVVGIITNRVVNKKEIKKSNARLPQKLRIY